MAEPTRRAIVAFAAMTTAAAQAAPAGIFDHTLPAIEGGSIALSEFRGRPMLVVNTASFCGFTGQYAALQRLHERYATRGLLVLGVPSTDFRQESTDAARIKAFCDAEYGVTFPMTTPLPVRGAAAHPLFALLAERGGGPPRWNFHKYVVGRCGVRVTGFPTNLEPDSRPVLAAIEAALTEAC